MDYLRIVRKFPPEIREPMLELAEAIEKNVMEQWLRQRWGVESSAALADEPTRTRRHVEEEDDDERVGGCT